MHPTYPTFRIELKTLPIPPHKHLYKVTYGITGNYYKYYYSDSPTVKDFMKHNNDTDIKKVEYIGRVFPDD